MTFLKAKNFISANIGFEKTILIKGKKDFQMLKNTLEKNFKVKTKKSFSRYFSINFYVTSSFINKALIFFSPTE